MNELLTCTLRDGRRYAWAEYGDPEGLPLVFLHGTPGGRLTVAHHHERYARQGLHVICPDRPGYGASDAAPGRRVSDVAGDLVDLLDVRGLGRVFVVGGSCGGPHALAFAAAVPERVRAVGVLVGAAPFLAEETSQLVGVNQKVVASLDRPDELRVQVEQLRTGLLEQGLAGLLPDAPESDRAQWTRNADALRQTLASALAPGTQGLFDDYRSVFGAPWGFDPADVKAPVVWTHGRHDRNIPLTAARRLADQLPDCRFITWTDIGHAPGPDLVADLYTAVLAAACRA